MYNQCTLCANTTLLAFQDENGFVQLGNFTSDGWILTQLSSRLDPAMGTGLALSPYYQKGLKDRINLYHQKSNLMMSRASLIVNSDNECALMNFFPFSTFSGAKFQKQSMMAGLIAISRSTSFHLAHPSPLLPQIPKSLQVSKPGSNF